MKKRILLALFVGVLSVYCLACTPLLSLSNPIEDTSSVVKPVKMETNSSIVVCRTKQCAPAQNNMSKEFLYNSMLQLLDNNVGTKVQFCLADEGSKRCIENYLSFAMQAGKTPGNVKIDYATLLDARVKKSSSTAELVLDYSINFNGISPHCVPSRSILFARSQEYMASQDYGFACKFTTIGKTTLSMFYSINYLDLDYGIVGAYYSVGSSGPAIGGGNGYMLMRFKNNAYPVKPRFVDPNDIGGNKRKGRPLHNNNTRRSINASPVHVGPIPKGEYKVMPLKKK